MAIIEYKKQIAPDKFVTRYCVRVDAINRYTNKRVQKKQSNIETKPKAIKRERELWALCRDGHPVLPQMQSWAPLRDHYLEHCWKNIRSETNVHGFSKKTYKNKKSILLRLGEIKSKQYADKGLTRWGKLHLDLITPRFLDDELNLQIATGDISLWTAAKIQKEVRAVFSYAVQVGFLKVNPLEGMKKRKVPKKRKQALTHEEANILLLEAKRRNHPFYLIWLLSIFLGCRRSELAGLKWTDIDFESRLVFIERQLIPNEGLVPYPKDKEPRPVPLHIDLVPILKEYKLKAQ